MNNNIDINKELKEKNLEMFLNKRKNDLENSMESLKVFYQNYCTTVTIEINERICSVHGIEPNSEQGKIFFNTIAGFFTLTFDKLKVIIDETINTIKMKMNNISDEDYFNELNHGVTIITNTMMEYYVENVNMLSSELTQDISPEKQNRINKYLFDVMTIKMMNMLKDKFIYSIKVISNNNLENNEVIESINEKTIKGV